MPQIKKKMSFLEKINNSPDTQMQRAKIEQAISTRYEVHNINVEDITFNEENDVFNSNDTDEDIEILANNIEQDGLLSPIVVVKTGDLYKLLSGERRTKAYLKKGWRTIPAFILENADEEYKQIELLYQANLQARNISVEQRFFAFRRLEKTLTSYKDNLHDEKKIEDIANMLNISRRSAFRLKQLNENADNEDIRLLQQNEITFDEFKRRTLEYVAKQQHDLDARKRILARAAEPINYIDPNFKSVYTVGTEHDKYFTFLCSTAGYMIGFHVPALPERENKNDAQADLDIFANSSGLKVYNGDFSEFNKAASNSDSSETVTEHTNEPTESVDKDNFTYEDVSAQLSNSDYSEDTENNSVAEDIATNEVSSTVDDITTVIAPVTPTTETHIEDNPVDVPTSSEEPTIVNKPSVELNKQLADFTAKDIYTGEYVRGSLYIKDTRAFIITNIVFGNETGNSKYSMNAVAVEVDVATVIRNDV